MFVSMIVFTLATVTEARFGQQNPPVEGEIGRLVGGTLGGRVPATLFGSSDPCDKLKLADEVVNAKPGDAAVLEAAKKLVQTEANFNPFTSTGPKFCNDPALPVTQQLRGILALVSDEGVQPFGGNGALTAAQVNDLARRTLTQPLPANGKSVGQLFVEQGFINAVNKPAGIQPGAPAGNAPAPTQVATPSQVASPAATQTGQAQVTITITQSVCAPSATAVLTPPAPTGVVGNTGNQQQQGNTGNQGQGQGQQGGNTGVGNTGNTGNTGNQGQGQQGGNTGNTGNQQPQGNTGNQQQGGRDPAQILAQLSALVQQMAAVLA